MYDITILTLIAVGVVGAILAGRDMSIDRVRYLPRVPVEKPKQHPEGTATEGTDATVVVVQGSSARAYRFIIPESKWAGIDETEDLILSRAESHAADFQDPMASELERHRRAIRDLEKRMRALEEKSSQMLEVPERIEVPGPAKVVN